MQGRAPTHRCRCRLPLPRQPAAGSPPGARPRACPRRGGQDGLRAVEPARLARLRAHRAHLRRADPRAARQQGRGGRALPGLGEGRRERGRLPQQGRVPRAARHAREQAHAAHLRHPRPQPLGRGRLRRVVLLVLALPLLLAHEPHRAGLPAHRRRWQRLHRRRGDHRLRARPQPERHGQGPQRQLAPAHLRPRGGAQLEPGGHDRRAEVGQEARQGGDGANCMSRRRARSRDRARGDDVA